LVRVKSLVNQISDRDPELAAAAARALEARVVAATVTELLADGRRAGDIAVLLPALTQVKAYEYALRRWAVPYEVVRGRGFYQCQEIRDVVHLLAAVDDPDDGVALVGSLRSPLFGLSDATLARLASVPGGVTARFRAGERFADVSPAEADAAAAALRVLLELRADRERRPLAELVTAAVEATQLEAVLCGQFHGAQKVANVRKLVAQARAFERRRFSSLREFVRHTRRLLARESHEPEAPRLATAADAVQVMTIHQAKGLEFPVVILPDLGREPPRDYRSPVLLDGTHGVLAIPSFGTGRYRLPHRLVEARRREDVDREDAERARLLYVACTRARDLLVLCEGKGRRSFLAADQGQEQPGRTWCEQIWSFLGRAAIAAFVAGPDERMVIEAPGEGADGEPVVVAVEIEKSAALLARVPPPQRDPVEARLADVERARPLPDEVAAVERVYEDLPHLASEVVVSPTALADFARCPRQFWYRHLRALPERGIRTVAACPDDGGAGNGDAARLGLAAHAVLEVLDVDLAPDARAASAAATLAAMPELGAAERAAIARDLSTALVRLGDVPEVYGREVPFCLPVAGPPALFVRGRIDFVGARGTHVVVRDYKYARPTDGEAYRMQMEAYALAVATAHPGRPIDVEIEWLREPGGRAVLAVDLEDAGRRLRAIATALTGALDAGSPSAFPPAFSDPAPCRACGCPFIPRCFPRTQPRRRTAIGGATP
jgi:ATP-dependent helicase/nuclease subunit A